MLNWSVSNPTSFVINLDVWSLLLTACKTPYIRVKFYRERWIESACYPMKFLLRCDSTCHHIYNSSTLQRWKAQHVDIVETSSFSWRKSWFQLLFIDWVFRKCSALKKQNPQSNQKNNDRLKTYVQNKVCNNLFAKKLSSWISLNIS